ncbi:RRS1-domain-containing protein [Linderina pennispora]|uniref:Ribosome biogenesis regulatory protein n=1 Tax=Linderina pennispora TaxID=61395 RepID=A0A1Y1W3R7_9FUNG|nr:RRS1-domain-containing protein [Linderina pennispora]ORX67945.1 RRS1-domain-containing protein [Linderina pennispora]
MDVSGILQEHKDRFRSVQVDKLVPVDFDLGHLASFDINLLDPGKLKASQKTRDAYLKEISRDGAQLMINELFSLPTVVDDDSVYAQLPKPQTTLPREKPLPKEKAETRWEKFAKIKGIQTRKHSRMVFDEESGEYKPRFGYKSAKNEEMNQWAIPVPDNADPYEDQYAKLRTEKKERVAKNDRRRQRNAEEAMATERGMKPHEMRKSQLQRALVMSKGSTASLGKFDTKLTGEPKIKGVKRKFDPLVGSADKEKSKNMDILNRVNKGEAKASLLNVRKAQRALGTNKQVQAEMNTKGKKQTKRSRK